MMTLAVREMLVVGRRRAFAVAAALFVAAVTGYAVAWPTGVPLTRGASLLPQLQLVQEWLVALIVPWVACRCGTRERGNELVRLAILSGVRPSRIVAARFLGVSAAATAVTLAGLPIVVFAQQAAAAGTSAMLIAETRGVLTAVTATALALGCEHVIPDYRWRWLAGTAAAALFVALRLGMGAGDLGVAALALVAVGWVGAVATRADTTLRYLSEEPA